MWLRAPADGRAQTAGLPEAIAFGHQIDRRRLRLVRPRLIVSQRDKLQYGASEDDRLAPGCLAQVAARCKLTSGCP